MSQNDVSQKDVPQKDTSQRNIVIVLPDRPVPANTGYHLRMLSTIAICQSLGWRTSLVWFGSSDAVTPVGAIPHADHERQIATRTAPASIGHRVLQRAGRLVGTVVGRELNSYPFSVPYEGGRDAVLREVARGADAVLLPTTLCHWAPSLRATGAIVIGDAVDIVSDLTMRLLTSEGRRHPFRAPGLAVNALACRAQERRFLPDFDEVWVTSAGEADRARELGARAVLVIPSTCEAWEAPASDIPADPIIGFIGNYRMAPNHAAARFLADEVLPRVQQSIPTATLRLAGDGSLSELQPRPGLEVLGPVANATDFVSSCAVAALPVRVRGGVPLKLFEAMALGRPIVATPELIAGLPIVSDHDVMIGDTADSFANAVTRLLTDRSLAVAQAATARRTFEREFSLTSAITRAHASSVLR